MNINEIKTTELLAELLKRKGVFYSVCDNMMTIVAHHTVIPIQLKGVQKS